jgi:hypothetical protein
MRENVVQGKSGSIAWRELWSCANCFRKERLFSDVIFIGVCWKPFEIVWDKTELPHNVPWLVTFCETWNYMIEKCFCTWISSYFLPPFVFFRRSDDASKISHWPLYPFQKIHCFAVLTLQRKPRKEKSSFWGFSIVCFLNDEAKHPSSKGDK